MKSLLLIDNRVNDTSTVIQSLNDNTNYVIIDYDNDTYDTIINKIGNIRSYNNVGIFQENYDLDYYQFVNTFEKSVLKNVEKIDNSLDSWSQFKQLLSYFKNVLMASNIDLMGCSIHSNINWNFVIEKIQNEIGININSSNDNTGNSQIDGNWILESNNENLIGLYFTENIKKYKFVLGFSNKHSVFLMGNGTVYSCGLNNYGQLGDGTTTTRLNPVKINLENIVQVTTGEFYTICLSNTGNIYAFGRNVYGQFGNSNTRNSSTPVQVIIKKADNSPVTDIIQVSAGSNHTLFLKSDGTVLSTGLNSGRLGNGLVPTTSKPAQVIKADGSLLTDIIQVSAGFDHSLFLKSDGTVYASGGITNYGQLGNGTTERYLNPTQVIKENGQPLTDITKISVGFYYSLFLNSTGTVYACGKNDSGQLGPGLSDTSYLNPVPVIIDGNPLSNIKQISASNYHSMFLYNDGQTLICGYNNYGQLGDGTEAGVVKNTNMVNLTNIVQVNTGSYSSFFLSENKNVYSCGDNSDGQLGDGTLISPLYTTIVKNNNITINFDNKLNYIYSINDYNDKYYLLKNTNGFSNTNVNYTVNDLLIFGISVPALKTTPYNFTDSDILNSTNVPLFKKSWFEGYYTIEQIISVYSAYQLYYIGYTILEIYSYYITYTYSAEKLLYESGFKLSFLLSSIPDYTLSRLLDQQNSIIPTLLGITNPPTPNFIYTIQDLLTTNDKLDRKLAITDFVNGGVKIKYLYENGISIESLLLSYSVVNLLTTSTNEINSDNKLTVPQFLSNGKTIQFLVNNSVPLQYLISHGISIEDLLLIYPVLDLLTTIEGDGKITVSQFLAIGKTIQFLVDNFVTIEYLYEHNNITIKYLYENGVSIQKLLLSYSVVNLLTTSTNEINSDNKLTVPQFISNGYAIQFLVNNFVTIKYLFNHGISIEELILNYPVLDLLTTSTNEINSDNKLTVPQFIAIGKTIPFFVENFVKINYLINHGISIEDLLLIYNSLDLITTNNGVDGKLTIRQLLTLGVTIRKIVEDGTTLQTLLVEPNNFTMNDLYDYNGNNGKFNIVELRLHDITFKQLVNSDANISISNILNFYSTYDILSKNIDEENIKFTISELLSYNITIKRIVTDFETVGKTIYDLLNTLYYNLTISDLLTSNNGLDGRLTIKELIYRGIKFQQLVNPPINISITTLRNEPNNFKLIDDENQLYDLLTSQDEDGKFSVRQLLKLNNTDTEKFTIDDFFNRDLNIRFLNSKGISFREIRFNCGVNILSFLINPNFYSVPEILTTNGGIDGKFTFQEILNDGFNFSDFFIFPNNFSISDLLTSQSGDGKFTFKQMNEYGVPISFFLNSYNLSDLVSPTDGTDGKYTFKELFNNGVSIIDFLNSYSLSDLVSSNNGIDGKFTITELLANNVTFTQLYNSYQNKNSIITILLTYFTVLELLSIVDGDAKLTVQNFKNGNFSILFLINNNVKFKYLIENGVLINELIDFPLFYKIPDLLTTNNGLDGKFTIRELIELGITFQKLLVDGITVYTLINPPNSFEISEILSSNKGVDGKLTFKQLYLGGILISTLLNYTTNNSFIDLIESGILVTTLIDSPNNYTISYLFENGISFLKMLADGVPVSNLLDFYNITYLISNGISIDYLINNGYYELLIENGVNVSNIKLEVSTLLYLGFTKDYIINLALYTNFELLTGGFTTNDLISRGIISLTPTNSEELLIALNSEFTNIYINQNLRIEFTKIMSGNSIAKKLRNTTNMSSHIILL